MKRRTKILITVAVVILLGGITAASLLSRGKEGTPVAFGKTATMDLVSKVTANGRIDAKRKVDLSANVMGQIVNLAVREGDVVKKDDFLLQIDQKQLAASAEGAAASMRALFSDRDAARTTLDITQRDYDRARRNYDEKIIPLADLERARSSVDTARANVTAIEQRIQQSRANLTAARDTLSKTTMRAPMAGIITALPVEEGEVAVIGTMNNAGTKLLTIADMSVVEAVMEVDETDIPSVRVGQRATVTIDAYPNKTWSGIVTEVGSSPITRTGLSTSSEAVNFEVKIQLEHPPADVRPGFSASADIITGTRAKTLAIPIQALVVREKPGSTPGKSQDEEGVFVVKDGKAQFVPVTTGLAGESDIEITSGLKAGTTIITGPFRALRELKDGEKVREQKEEKTTGDKSAEKK
ncbi:MAG: efflux RND transporter periplasmic adaptor subunit [Acidobacteria bacterium]|nr:efflux RND transporter periplasmic adaptor subunit [Acidobacteriota bacterium]MBV9477929.1 efflux RND transporter periplasmic adaptor subunit [Acidobacteriota bacterium]